MVDIFGRSRIPCTADLLGRAQLNGHPVAMTDTLAQVADTNGDNFNILQSLQTGFTTPAAGSQPR